MLQTGYARSRLRGRWADQRCGAEEFPRGVSVKSYFESRSVALAKSSAQSLTFNRTGLSITMTTCDDASTELAPSGLV